MSWSKIKHKLKPEPKGTPAQKGILWLFILLATAYYICVMSYHDWPSGYAYIECPEDSRGGCINALFDCQISNSHAYNIISWDHSCPQIEDQERGQSICKAHPELCEFRHMTPGMVLGQKPPKTIQSLPSIVSVLLILGAAGWFYIGRKEKQKHAK